MVNGMTRQCSDGDILSSTTESPILEINEDGDEETVVCPGEAASERLAQFEKSWSSIETNSISINDIQKVVEEDLCITRKLGSGSFSDVYLASSIKDTHNIGVPDMAIKKPSSRNERNECAGDFAFETALLANLKHENIIALKGIKEGNIIELMKEGTFFLALDLLDETLDCRLKRYKKQQKQRIFHSRAFVEDFIKNQLKDVAMGIVNGMEYVHSKKILYRDLKPENIGFDMLRDQVKIFDFGLARLHIEDSSPLITGRAGTPRYMAPELVATATARYSYSSDVYSFSLLLWQIISIRTPFAECKSTNSLFDKVSRGVRPSLKCIQDKKIKELIQDGWSCNPRHRPSFSEIRHAMDNIIKECELSLLKGTTKEKKG